MRDLPPALADRLASGVTTLARCWRLQRRDGVVRGFTDHDRPLDLDGLACEPAAGFTASEVPASVGLGVDTAEVDGALVSPFLTEEDLASGRYDGARLELWIVDWREPAIRFCLAAGELGEVTRTGAAFKAEVRALSHRLDQEVGRVYQATCDAIFADARCGVDPSLHRRRVTVLGLDGPRTLRVTAADAPGGRFTRGTATVVAGSATGDVLDIRDDRPASGARIVELWAPPIRAIRSGDALDLLPGCDKSYETCTTRFGNGVNFQGFPHMPGNDFALSYPRRGEGNDGGRLTGG